jgi:hypothetical protein
MDKKQGETIKKECLIFTYRLASIKIRHCGI